MAKYSPGRRPSTIEENPSTGCSGRGNVTPLFGFGVTSAPAGGPPPNVLNGRTARPRSSGAAGVGPPLAGLAWPSGAHTTPKPAATAEAIAIRVMIDRRRNAGRNCNASMTFPFAVMDMSTATLGSGQPGRLGRSTGFGDERDRGMVGALL